MSLTGKAFRGTENVKHSLCPGCVRDELAAVDAGLHALQVSDLLDNVGIARRFEGCEFSNYQAVNQGAAKTLQHASAMSTAGRSVLTQERGW